MNGATLIQVRQKAQITLPQKIRRILGIQEGDYLEAQLEKNRLVLRPKAILDKFPLVELSKRGKAMLDEALQDVRRGRLHKFDNVDDLIAYLHH